MVCRALSTTDSDMWRRGHILLLLSLAVLGNGLVWLDSLDQYLAARYHLALSAQLPEALFQPSRQIKLALSEWDSSGPSPAFAAHPPPIVAKSPVEPQAEATAEADRAPAAPTPEAPPTPTSTPTAPLPAEPRILFAGDSMMQGVAPLAIAELRHQFPKGRYLDLSKQSTGLTVRRYFDWPTRIKDEIVKQKLNLVVIFLGPNDPWDIYDGAQRHVFPGEAWQAKYRERVAEVLQFAQAHQTRIIWIGLPSMRNERVRQGALLQNWIFYEETHKYGFIYLPTDDLLGSPEQPFKKFIDDPVRGQITVRSEDGIHFKPEGLDLIKQRLLTSIASLYSS